MSQEIFEIVKQMNLDNLEVKFHSLIEQQHIVDIIEYLVFLLLF